MIATTMTGGIRPAPARPRDALTVVNRFCAPSSTYSTGNLSLPLSYPGGVATMTSRVSCRIPERIRSRVPKATIEDNVSRPATSRTDRGVCARAGDARHADPTARSMAEAIRARTISFPGIVIKLWAREPQGRLVFAEGSCYGGLDPYTPSFVALPESFSLSEHLPFGPLRGVFD